MSKKKVEIDGVEVSGEIVPVLRQLRKLFLQDQEAEHCPKDYQRMKGLALAQAVGIDDDATLRRRVLNFRKKLATEYRARHGRDIDPQAIIDNERRAGYRLNPCTVALTA